MAHSAGLDQIVTLARPNQPYESKDPVTHADWACVGWRQDAEETVQALATWKPDWIVIDHYAFDARWHRHAARHLHARVAAIDDLADRRLEVQYLIDQNLSSDHRAKYRSLIEPSTAVLGGPRFALLGPRYSQMQPMQIADKVSSIGIFMGGIDAANLSAVALRACRDHARFDGPVEVVTTAANPNLQALKTLSRQWPDTHVLTDLPDLADFFVRHGLQLGAGGVAAWERCCAGAPTLVLKGAANQEAVIPALADIGAVATLPAGAVPDPDTIGECVSALLNDSALRRKLARVSRELVDGLGARRVVCALAHNALALRGASLSDANLAYEWRNHPETRRFSLDSRAIAVEEHQEWWRRSLLDPQRMLFIAHLGRHDLGVLRLDFGADEANVSIYVDPRFTGLGLGQAMLRAAQSLMIERRPSTTVERLVAQILPTNHASQVAFEKVGFKPKRGRWTWNIPLGVISAGIGEKHEDR
jgi:UDP-2,4-diacetamido-2,4,6-trideoxy-beta-L-altropyranose hydrolase